MRDLFEVRSSTGSHPVRMTDQSLADLVAASSADVVIADAFFRPQLENSTKHVVFVEAVEESKELTALAPIVEQLRKAGLSRTGLVLAVGGGIIQDLSCFIASVYMRGVKWTYLPTTLLAMVDSCIGGKSSINVAEYKNLLGTFFPPESIVIVPSVVDTLPPEHIAAGRSEAAKICYAHSESIFDEYLGMDHADGHDVEGLVALSLTAKKWFVEKDEFDRAERLLLNFGHSFGHALESCTAYALPHGVAVGVGCLAAVEMSLAQEPALSKSERVGRLQRQLIAIIGDLDILDGALRAVDREAFFRYWNSDKKHSSDTYRPILLGADGRLIRPLVVRDEHSRDLIWQAFERARDHLLAA